MSKNNNEYKSLRLGVDPPFVSKLAKQTYHENLKPHPWQKVSINIRTRIADIVREQVGLVNHKVE